MFSGIVADIGVIERADKRDGGLRLTVATQQLGLDDVQLQLDSQSGSRH